MGLEVLKTSTNGYADVRVGARDTAATESETTYKFDGKQYRESKTMLVHLETGETKPSSRRVQFKRGSSSATITGRVSIALPDTLLIGARTGQDDDVKPAEGGEISRYESNYKRPRC